MSNAALVKNKETRVGRKKNNSVLVYKSTSFNLKSYSNFALFFFIVTDL